MSYNPSPLISYVTSGMPSSWLPNSIYYVRLGNSAQTNPAASDYPRTEVFVTNGSGVPLPVGNNTLIDGRIQANVALETSAPPDTTTGTTYYIDPAGNNANNGTSQSTPWATPEKITSTTLAPGSTVLFKRGAVYTDGFTVGQNGTAGNPIQFSAYGSGAKPVLSGMRTLTNWTSQGGGIWSCPHDSGSKLQMVTIDGVIRAMGKWPTTGFNTVATSSITNGSGGTSTGLISDNALNGFNWTGAEVVIRKRDWVMDRCQVTGHSGNLISFSSDDQHIIQAGHGYFIQNHLGTLDAFGEWFYNSTTKVLYVHFGSDNPNTHVIKAAIPQTLVSIQNRNYINIDNLNLIGSNEYHINMQDSNYCKLTNNLMAQGGGDFVYGWYADYFRIEKNTLEDVHNTGMTFLNTINIAIRNNTIRRCGLMAGMGRNNNQQRNGIFAQGMSALSVIESNVIEHVGYCGITWKGDNLIIRKNIIDGFCETVTDGGGIYTWEERDKFNRKVYENIVINGKGEWLGSSHTSAYGAVGIYNDDLTGNVEYFRNVSAHNALAGLYLHNAHHMEIYDNLFYNNASQLLMAHDTIGINPDGDGVNYPIRFVHFYHNTLVAKTENQICVDYWSMTDDFNQVGVFENNSYNKPYGLTGNAVVTRLHNGSGFQPRFFGLNGWKNKYTKDAGTTVQPYNYARDTVLTTLNSNMSYNSAYNDSSFAAADNATVSIETKLTGTAMKVVPNSSNGSNVLVYFYLNGALAAGDKLQVKFDTICNAGNDGFGGELYVIENGGSYLPCVNEVFYPEVKSTATTVLCVFTVARNVAAAQVTFRIKDDLNPSWYDNIDIRKVTSTTVDPAPITKLELNKLDTPVYRTLAVPYVDPQNNTYTGAVNVDRNTAAALILKP